MVLAHANGFCRSTWRPVIEELRTAGVPNAVVAWDQRGHGGSDRPPLPVDWWDNARDALAVCGGVDGEIVGIGHSMGAAALLMAEIVAPGTFSRLVVIEPIVFPPPYRPVDHHPLAEGARRRRRFFPSPDDALTHFASRPVFAAWDRRALEGYVDCGLRREGDGWVLACPPEYEAALFAQGAAHDAWDRLGEVGVPVLVVAGGDSSSHPEEFAAEQAARLRRSRLEIVAGSGHFLPMEQPAVVAGMIAQEVESISAS